MTSFFLRFDKTVGLLSDLNPNPTRSHWSCSAPLPLPLAARSGDRLRRSRHRGKRRLGPWESMVAKSGDPVTLFALIDRRIIKDMT